MAEPMAVPEQMPSNFCARFDEFPEAKNWTLGQEVELKVKGKVVGLSAPDKYSKGEARLEINGGNMSSKDMQDMPLKELRKKLPVKEDE